MATTKTRIGNLFFNYQGEYSSTKTYYKDDVVMYNNTDWICTKNSATTGTACLLYTSDAADEGLV